MNWANQSLSAVLMVIVIKELSGHTHKCLPTEYSLHDDCCEKCPAGHYVQIDCSKFGGTVCQPCEKGRFQRAPNARTICFRCATCDPGSGVKTKRSCTETSDTACEPMEGFYCIGFTEGSCTTAQKHCSCQPGQFISHQGNSSTDTQCITCSNGTYSANGLSLSCLPHTKCEDRNLRQVKPGTVLADAECSPMSRSHAPAIVASSLCLIIALIVVIGKQQKKWRWSQTKGFWHTPRNCNVNITCEEGTAETPLFTDCHKDQSEFYQN